MRIGETIATYDVGLALRGKSGKFEITSPAGEIYDVTCKPNHSISYLEWPSNGTENPPFLIKKVAEGASSPDAKAPDMKTTAKTTTAVIAEAESQAATPPIPFMLEEAADHRLAANLGNFELSYLEDDPETGQPSARLFLNSDSGDSALGAGTPMTSRCATLNELDSEIRRLQAQLDEIRSRAKKMFYRTRALEASA